MLWKTKHVSRNVIKGSVCFCLGANVKKAGPYVSFLVSVPEASTHAANFA